MSRAVLEISGLGKRFGPRWAVRDLSMSVAPGEVLAMVGQNGAGKSTTLRMLCGLVRPTTGEALLEGRTLRGRAGTPQRRRLGAIVEGPRFYPHLSGAANLDLLRRLHGADAGRVDAMLRAVGLDEARDERFGRYSMGMKQRLGLAAVLLHEPPLIVLDEPTAGLDPVGRTRIHALLQRVIAEHGVSVLLSSHLLDEVHALAHRAVVLHRGRLYREQTLSDDDDRAALSACITDLAADEPAAA